MVCPESDPACHCLFFSPDRFSDRKFPFFCIHYGPFLRNGSLLPYRSDDFDWFALSSSPFFRYFLAPSAKMIASSEGIKNRQFSGHPEGFGKQSALHPLTKEL